MNQPKPRTVLVAVDYSETSLLALKQAFALATGALHVVHVAELLPPAAGIHTGSPVADGIEAAVKVLGEYLQRHAAELSTRDGSKPGSIVCHFAQGSPAQEIVQLASDLEADLIVLGTHGRRGVQRFLLGSVAERVVRLAPCPVLVERPRASPDDETPRIEPPCAACLQARRESAGRELWCAQHRERHGRRHTYHVAQSPDPFPPGRGGLGSVS
jgi:nucleotide-binding universal stress UspA family protein